MKFPVLHAPENCPKYVDKSKLNEDWALRIHRQTLDRLAERGGLSPQEIMLNIKRGDFWDIKTYTETEAVEIVKSIEFKDGDTNPIGGENDANR